MSHPLIERDYRSLAAVVSAATIAENPDGSALITVPNVALRPTGGWNVERTNVMFLAPVGYPQSRPDCFWTDAGVRLASGALPKNSGLQNPPHVPEPRLWFSWHVSHWDPSKDNFLTYLNVIKRRLREPE